MTATTAWAAVALCAAATFLLKGAGPAASGGRDLPPAVGRVLGLLGPALLAALVVTQAAADGQQLRAGADTAGVAVAGILLWRRVPLLVAVAAAALTAAILRALARP